MGVEAMTRLIAAEAEAEAADFVAEAERMARLLVEGAEAEVSARVAEAMERLGAEIRAAGQRRINAVRLRILEDRARLDAERLASVFRAAASRVRAISDGGDPERWARSLRAICAAGLALAGADAVVTVRGRDAGSLSELVTRHGARLRTVADDVPAVLSVTSADGRIEVDAAPEVRLARAQALLAEPVAKALALKVEAVA